MKYIFSLFLILAISSNAWGLSQIDILSVNNNDNFKGYTFTPPFNQLITVHLDLGESLSSKVLNIFPKNDSRDSVKIQMESSLTVMNEGPHLDLANWKHCTTVWIEAEKLSDFKFKLPITEKIDSECFSDVPIAEIKKEVFKIGGDRWSNLIRDDASIDDYPMDIALSSVLIKIEKLIHDKWETITVIKFSVPMGC